MKFILALLTSMSVVATESQLTVIMGSQKKEFTTQQLLAHPRLTKIKVAADPAYGGRPQEYSAVPAAELFKELAVAPDSTVVFNCLDGFSGPLNKDELLNQMPQKSIAYIAIENPKTTWKPLRNGTAATPGPFYLIWQDPQKSNIGREQWPFQLASLEIKPSLHKQYPLIAPKSREVAVQSGFRSFVKNCFTCHTMNGQGTSQMGPDLNVPHSPSEYLADGFLQQMIRDPQKVRHWPQAKMKGFSANEISDTEIMELIAYMKAMAKERGSR